MSSIKTFVSQIESLSTNVVYAASINEFKIAIQTIFQSLVNLH